MILYFFCMYSAVGIIAIFTFPCIILCLHDDNARPIYRKTVMILANLNTMSIYIIFLAPQVFLYTILMLM